MSNLTEKIALQWISKVGATIYMLNTPYTLMPNSDSSRLLTNEVFSFETRIESRKKGHGK